MRVSKVVGFVLVIVGMAAAAYGQAQVLRHAAKTPHVSYAVGKGDTLYGVSRRFNLPVSRIAAANGLRATSQLTRGMVLLLPDFKSDIGIDPYAHGALVRTKIPVTLRAPMK